MSTKYIFVTGGVISGLGKGVFAASIGRLLKARGFKVFVQKFDPYLNVDPGTMSPYEHGEVYVTADGAETDLDLGHYERFIDENFSKYSNYTTAQIFQKIMIKERKGFYKGKTVQIVPHFTNEIKDLLKLGSKTSQADFIITEIGGTVGDIESMPYFIALASLFLEEPENCFFIHVAYVPFLTASNEWKTKPTQYSTSQLWSFSIKPNMLVLRSTKKVSSEIKWKISQTTFVNRDSIISLPDVKNIYEIPLFIEKQKVAHNILNYFNIEQKPPSLDNWKKYVNKTLEFKQHKITIAMIGKYIEFQDAYLSIIEAIKISGNYNSSNIVFKWIQSSKITKKNIIEDLQEIDGVVILPGFGPRGFEGKLITAEYTREHDIPTLGICFGMQAMTICQAKKIGIKDATTSEFSETGTFIFDLIRGKKRDSDIGNTLRIGESPILIKPGSLIEKIYGKNKIHERHRHRYEVNPAYVDKIQDKNFQFSGFSEKNNLVEICELKNKNFYIGVQYHPEFTARPLKPSPLFSGFVKAVIKTKKHKKSLLKND